MMRLHGYRSEWLEVLRRQDELLRTEKMTAEDALELGLIMVRLAKEVYKAPMAFKIILGGQTTFSYLMDGASSYNEWWMSKKLNTCLATGVSSILTLVEIGVGVRTPDPEFDNANNYALCGGCIPLRNRAGHLLGYVLTSGMAHHLDHNLAVDALCEFLHVDAPRLEGSVED